VVVVGEVDRPIDPPIKSGEGDDGFVGWVRARVETCSALVLAVLDQVVDDAGVGER
jgi:hypothetical protein